MTTVLMVEGILNKLSQALAMADSNPRFSGVLRLTCMNRTRQGCYENEHRQHIHVHDE